MSFVTQLKRNLQFPTKFLLCFVEMFRDFPIHQSVQGKMLLKGLKVHSISLRQ